MLLCAALVAFGAFAQEGADPTKETVIIDPFTYGTAASAGARDNVRSAVMTGLSNVARFYVVDALTDSRVSQLYQNRDAEEVVNDANWQEQSTAAYKAMGATKLIKGQVDLISTYTKKDDDGKVFYYCDLNFTLSTYDLTDGSMAGSETYKYHELSSVSSEDAFNEAIRKTTKDMKQFCNKFFPIESYVLELGETDKKGVLKDLWISGGKDVGIQSGTIFLVKTDVKRGPKTSRVTIGQVVAKDVEDDMTRCQVNKKEDGAAITEAYNNGQKLYVVLDRARGDGIKSVGRMFGF